MMGTVTVVHGGRNTAVGAAGMATLMSFVAHSLVAVPPYLPAYSSARPTRCAVTTICSLCRPSTRWPPMRCLRTAADALGAPGISVMRRWLPPPPPPQSSPPVLVSRRASPRRDIRHPPTPAGAALALTTHHSSQRAAGTRVLPPTHTRTLSPTRVAPPRIHMQPPVAYVHYPDPTPRRSRVHLTPPHPPSPPLPIRLRLCPTGGSCIYVHSMRPVFLPGVRHLLPREPSRLPRVLQ